MNKLSLMWRGLLSKWKPILIHTFVSCHSLDDLKMWIFRTNSSEATFGENISNFLDISSVIRNDYVCLCYLIHFGGHLLLTRKGVNISQRCWKLSHGSYFRSGIRTIESRTSSILFQHSATKRDSHIYILRQVLNSETTNIWFNVGCSAYVLSVKVECFGLNFQVQMIMLNVESVSWIIDDSVEVSTWKLSAAIILHDVRSIGMLGV